MGGVLELLLRLVISMAAVMAVMALAARLVRRRQGLGPLLPARPGSTAGRGRGPIAAGARTRPRKVRPAAPIEVVYRRALAKGATVSLVEATGRTFLLGVTDHSITLLAELAGETSPGVSSGTEQRTAGGSVDLAELDEWQQSGRMPFCERGPAPAETSDKAWKLALDSLRERTVRR